MDNAAAVEVVDGVVLGIAPGEDAVKELAAGGELKGEVVLGLRLETSVKFDRDDTPCISFSGWKHSLVLILSLS